MDNCKVLAFDFGASTGRAILGTLDNGKLNYEEVHRFDNIPVEKDGTLYWDIDALMTGIKEGIEKAGVFDGIGFDTWGVDFGLLDEEGKLITAPVHYRDSRTVGMIPEVTDKIGTEKLYELTGNQIMEINSLFQLMALKKKQPEVLEKAKTLLFMPDLFAYLISGAKVCEQCIASTSQMLDLKEVEWCKEMLEELEIPTDMLLPVVKSGTVTGELPNGAKVIAVAGHDTQCAVAAVPFKCENAAFLSCGTWSLFGAELDEPILTQESVSLELSNELGANGKINYLKNIVGLWLIQESRRQWQREGVDYSFAELADLALVAKPFQCFIDPDDALFTAPGDMPERIKEFCRQTNQYVPQNVGEVARCIYESLAMKYHLALEQIGQVTGKQFDMLHIIGGGSQAKILCQMAASSCGVPVAAGPVEATAIGNLMIQFVALGALKDIEEGRKMIAESESLTYYEPDQKEDWQKAYAGFVEILKRRS